MDLTPHQLDALHEGLRQLTASNQRVAKTAESKPRAQHSTRKRPR